MSAAEITRALGGKWYIAPDPDDKGRQPAEALASRAYGLGWRVRIMQPPAGGGDWSDEAIRVAELERGAARARAANRARAR